jgi:hypothetical protein
MNQSGFVTLVIFSDGRDTQCTLQHSLGARQIVVEDEDDDDDDDDDSS